VNKIELIPILGLPEFEAGMNIGELIASKIELSAGDILVIAQKIVSKSEGRIVEYKNVVPSQYALTLSKKLNKDPRKIEVILNETSKIIRAEKTAEKKEGVLICRHRLGFICANAGVDESNVGGANRCLLLPENPDKSAKNIRTYISERIGIDIGVVITDTFGRPWRLGLTNIAIGSSGVSVIKDLRGKKDSSGRILTGTVIAVVDELAASAGLVMGKLNRVPAVLIRGFKSEKEIGNISDILRKEEEDLFL